MRARHKFKQAVVRRLMVCVYCRRYLGEDSSMAEDSECPCGPVFKSHTFVRTSARNGNPDYYKCSTCQKVVSLRSYNKHGPDRWACIPWTKEQKLEALPKLLERRMIYRARK